MEKIQQMIFFLAIHAVKIEVILIERNMQFHELYPMLFLTLK